MIIIPVDENNKTEIASKARFLLMLDDSYNIVEKKDNPALASKEKRPAVAREAVKMNATYIAPHGSLCMPSNSIIKRSKITTKVSGVHEDFNHLNLKDPDFLEVFYSSMLAIYEHLKK